MADINFEVLRHAVRNRDLAPAAFKLLTLLFTYSDRQGKSFASLRTMASDLGRKAPAVVKQRNTLQARGYLSFERRTRDNGAHTSNEYTLMIPGEVLAGGEQGCSLEVNRVFTPGGEQGVHLRGEQQYEQPLEQPPQQSRTTRRSEKGTAIKRLFEQFKTSYPSRGAHVNGYEAAKPAFAQLARGGESPESLISAAANYAEHVRREGTAPRYVKTARRFLEEGVWREYVAPLPAEQAPRSRAAI